MSKEYEKELESRSARQYYSRLVFLVTGVLGAFSLTALAMSFFWDLFATDVHLPEVHFSGTVGILGLLLILIALVTGVYIVAVKEWGE